MSNLKTRPATLAAVLAVAVAWPTAQARAGEFLQDMTYATELMKQTNNRGTGCLMGLAKDCLAIPRLAELSNAAMETLASHASILRSGNMTFQQQMAWEEFQLYAEQVQLKSAQLNARLRVMGELK